MLIGQVLLAVDLFVPGTMNYWQGWAFMLVNFVVTVFFCAYFYKRDPQLLARRMLHKEKHGLQKVIVLLSLMAIVIFFLLCGLDNRLGWSRACLAPVPWWLTWLALLIFAGNYFLLIPICRANRFAATTIQVEPSQTVADRGPYRLVRHPMYSVALVIWVCLPIALGSFVTLPLVILMIPILIVRLLNEEEILRRDLPGYAEYCQRTRYRLIPLVW